jgi:hypothetical protein
MMFIVAGSVLVIEDDVEEYHPKILRIADNDTVDRRAQRMWANMRKRFPGEDIAVSVWRLDERNINKHDGSLNWGDHFHSMRDIKDWFVR